jgi:predicted nucleotide-binding protein (sugar kinase/HSP70/actin superfamily)
MPDTSRALDSATWKWLHAEIVMSACKIMHEINISLIMRVFPNDKLINAGLIEQIWEQNFHVLNSSSRDNAYNFHSTNNYGTFFQPRIKKCATIHT